MRPALCAPTVSARAQDRAPARQLLVSILAGLSALAFLCTVVVYDRARNEVARSQFWTEISQWQLREAQRQLAQAREDRAGALVARALYPMAAELPELLRRLPPDHPTERITVTAQEWRVRIFTQTQGGGQRELIFPRPSAAKDMNRVAHLDE